MAQIEPREKILQTLSEFSETTHRYQHRLGILYTEGVSYLEKATGADWLIDIVATAQNTEQVRIQTFQIWSLSVDFGESTAVLTCDDGDNVEESILYQQKFDYIEFPLEKVELFFENNVLSLPNEN